MKHLADGTHPPALHERSTGDLVKLLSEQVSVLVRDELKLAQVEMTRSGGGVARGVARGRGPADHRSGSGPHREGPPAKGHAAGTGPGRCQDQDRHGRDKGKGTAMTTSESSGTPIQQAAAEAEASDGELFPGPRRTPLTLTGGRRPR